jgi:hypothetical protein
VVRNKIEIQWNPIMKAQELEAEMSMMAWKRQAESG